MSSTENSIPSKTRQSEPWEFTIKGPSLNGFWRMELRPKENELRVWSESEGEIVNQVDARHLIKPATIRETTVTYGEIKQTRF